MNTNDNSFSQMSDDEIRLAAFKLDDYTEEGKEKISREIHLRKLEPGVPAEPEKPKELYSAVAVSWATFFGSPIAGAIIMAKNFSRLGQPEMGRRTIVFAVLGTIILFFISWVLPKNLESIRMAFLFAPLVIMGQLTKEYQGKAIQKHFDSGGVQASTWRAAGIGVLCFIPMILILFMWGFLIPVEPYGEPVKFPSGDTVFYSGGATEADALFLYNVLNEMEFIGYSNIVDIKLLKTDEGFQIFFILDEKIWNSPEISEFFGVLGPRLASERFGRPLLIHRCDRTFNKLETLEIN